MIALIIGFTIAITELAILVLLISRVPEGEYGEFANCYTIDDMCVIDLDGEDEQ